MAETATVSTSTDDLTKEIERLKSENRKLAGELSDATEELKSTRAEARDRRHELKAQKEAFDALTKERDQFKAQAALDPENLRAQLADATGKLRERDHRDAFAKVAKAQKVTDPNRIADLYALSGYKPDGDQADEAKLTEVITAALKGRPHFLDPPPAGAGTTAPGGAQGANGAQPSGKPGPGAERGQSTQTEGSSTPRERIPGRL
jgi:hypothetical protein